MSYNIEVIDVTVQSVPRSDGKGTYDKASVTFKDGQGKVDSKLLVSFGAQAKVFNTLVTAKKGDTFSIERVKNDKGYWDWTGSARQDAVVSNGPAPAPRYAPNPENKAGVTTPVRSNYETPEERAQRQVYIVRQSSLANAVAYFGDNPARPTVEDIIRVAKEFENYVFGKGIEYFDSDEIE